MRRRAFVSMFTTLLICGSAALAARDADAQGRVDVRVGTLAAESPSTSNSAVRAFRRALVGATRLAPFLGRRGSAPLLLTGAVTKLERESRGEQMRLQCEISLVVMDRRGGQVRALLTGWAESTDASPRSASEAREQEEGVITAAVLSAVRQLWQSLDISKIGVPIPTS